MCFSLSPRFSRCFLSVLTLAGLVYCYLCWRSFRASELAASGDVESQLRAIRLEPQNAAYWKQLGDLRLYRENDPQASLVAFQRATKLNPRDADAWIGAAYALQLLDRPNDERDTIARALAAEPRRLEIVWQSANLYAVLGDRASMMKELCILLANDRARAKQAFELARRAAPNSDKNVVDCDLAEAAH